MIASNVFRALGDPIRLEMVRRLATGSPHTISTVSHGFNISRQGVRKHLQVLVDTDVVTLEPQGRDTYVHLNKDALTKAKAFVAQLEQQWDQRLEALRDYVETGV